VDENANNVTVGTFSTNDTDSGQEYAFSLVTGTGDTDNGSFTIVGGELKNTVSFNCEAKNSYSIRIKAVDAIDGCSTEKTVTIKVNDVNEASTDLDLSANSVMENVAANTIIGALSTSDPDTSTVFTYSLVTGAGSTDNSSFNISGKSLRITNSPDYEAKSSYSVRIKSSDIGGLTVENTYTINILDYANETAPVLGNLSNQTICPSKIGDAQTLSISDDNPSSLAFTMSSNNTALVPVSGISVTGTGTNRQVKVNPQSGQTGSAQITLIGKNSYQLTDTVKFTVNVMDQTPPDKPSLADINAICEVTSLDTATTTDGCAGTIKGTHNASLPYTNPGTYEITWTFSDKSGNSTTAIQKIVIRSIASQLDVVGNKITVSEENASYQWINCDNQEAIQGATQRTFTVTSSGNYAVIVSKNGCTDTSDCAAVVYNSIAEYTNSIQGQVFPNPTAHFTSFNAMESGTYRLINSLGQTVTTLEVKKGEVASMSVEGYPKGIYYLKGLGYNYTVIVDKP